MFVLYNLQIAEYALVLANTDFVISLRLAGVIVKELDTRELIVKSVVSFCILSYCYVDTFNL